MDSEIVRYISGYKGPIVITKLKQLILKDQSNSNVYLPLACQHARTNGYVGIYEELYAMPKKIPMLAGVKLPPYEECIQFIE